MTDLNEIQEFLGIEIADDKRLKKGKKKYNKNRYYYYKDHYYIVELTQDKWMVLDDSVNSRRLLRKHCWYFNNGYAMTTVDGSLKRYHQILLDYEAGMVADHINRNRFDNRLVNLRITTHRQNNRNRSKRTDNTSGKQGVNKTVDKRYGLSYWTVQIRNNDGKNIQKQFSIKKLGNAEAKRQAIAKRIELEQLYDYDGE
jgi:hypothetical protein